MKKFLGLILFFSLLVFAIFRFLYPNDVRVLDEFDFFQG